MLPAQRPQPRAKDVDAHAERQHTPAARQIAHFAQNNRAPRCICRVRRLPKPAERALQLRKSHREA
eukprot:scaffold100141_cov66-Phaeocystis_antarctica.AAC.1